MTQLNIFDCVIETNEAIARAGDNADAQWLEAALQAIRDCARDLGTFTADDVWELLNQRHTGDVREPRALGAVMRQAKGLGIIIATGQYRRSNRPQCHMNPKMVWMSA